MTNSPVLVHRRLHVILCQARHVATTALRGHFSFHPKRTPQHLARFSTGIGCHNQVHGSMVTHAPQKSGQPRSLRPECSATIIHGT